MIDRTTRAQAEAALDQAQRAVDEALDIAKAEVPGGYTARAVLTPYGAGWRITGELVDESGLTRTFPTAEALAEELREKALEHRALNQKEELE